MIMRFRQMAAIGIFAMFIWSMSCGDVQAANQPAAQGSSEPEAIRALIAQIAKSATAANSHDLAALFSSDGTYIDEDGVESRGRQVIESHLAEAFKQSDQATIELSTSDIRILGGDNAWVRGGTKRKTADGFENSRFVMLLHKSDGHWQIESATELAVAGEKTPSQLQTLSWLVGAWSAERGKSRVKMTCEWVGNKSFLVSKYQIEEEGKAPRMELQIIGWDPLKEQIVSWHFDANGGFGYGTWLNKEKQWICLGEGVSDTGDRTLATNVVSTSGNDQFSWQSINRKVSGLSVPDTESIIVKRVAP